MMTTGEPIWRPHIAGAGTVEIPLTDIVTLGQHVPNGSAMLVMGLAAMDETATIADIEARMRTARPLASPEWIAEAERAMMRTLGPAKRGPKPRKRAGDGNLV